MNGLPGFPSGEYARIEYSRASVSLTSGRKIKSIQSMAKGTVLSSYTRHSLWLSASENAALALGYIGNDLYLLETGHNNSSIKMK